MPFSPTSRHAAVRRPTNLWPVWVPDVFNGCVVNVLGLHGSPGSGKSTLARALSEALRVTDIAHGVIDLDDFSIVHPYPGRQFPRDILRADWLNDLAAAPDIKLILPLVFADE